MAETSPENVAWPHTQLKGGSFVFEGLQLSAVIGMMSYKNGCAAKRRSERREGSLMCGSQAREL